jgi:D-inositol-3-phosphate glycosyltransferase
VIGGDVEDGQSSQSEEVARLKAMQEQAGVSDLITYLGKRGQDTLPYYYSAAEAVVVPSHYESFGMVALEAMACGTPVVASQVGGLAFLVQDGVTGYTVPVDDPQALADRLYQLLCDPSLRKSLGLQARTLAQEYAWERIAERIIALYREVVAA